MSQVKIMNSPPDLSFRMTGGKRPRVSFSSPLKNSFSANRSGGGSGSSNRVQKYEEQDEDELEIPVPKRRKLQDKPALSTQQQQQQQQSQSQSHSSSPYTSPSSSTSQLPIHNGLFSNMPTNIGINVPPNIIKGYQPSPSKNKNSSKSSGPNDKKYGFKIVNGRKIYRPLIPPWNNKVGPELNEFMDEAKRRHRERYNEIPFDSEKYTSYDAFRKHKRRDRLKSRQVAGYHSTYATMQVPQPGFGVQILKMTNQFVESKLLQASLDNIPKFHFTERGFEKKIQYEKKEYRIHGITSRLAQTFYPHAGVGFSHSPTRVKLAAKLQKRVKKQKEMNIPQSPCIEAGPKHGTQCHRSLKVSNTFFRGPKDESFESFAKTKNITEIDPCVLSILAKFDACGCTLLDTEFRIWDCGAWYFTDVDGSVWQSPGFYDHNGKLMEEGVYFYEFKTGYEGPAFDEVFDDDPAYVCLPALSDTPYNRAVLQLVISMVSVKMRYNYSPQGGKIAFAAPRRGETGILGLDEWTESIDCVTYLYFCFCQNAPKAHLQRVMMGMQIDCSYIPDMFIDPTSNTSATGEDTSEEAMMSSASSAMKSAVGGGLMTRINTIMQQINNGRRLASIIRKPTIRSVLQLRSNPNMANSNNNNNKRTDSNNKHTQQQQSSSLLSSICASEDGPSNSSSSSLSTNGAGTTNTKGISLKVDTLWDYMINKRSVNKTEEQFNQDDEVEEISDHRDDPDSILNDGEFYPEINDDDLSSDDEDGDEEMNDDEEGGGMEDGDESDCGEYIGEQNPSENGDVVDGSLVQQDDTNKISTSINSSDDELMSLLEQCEKYDATNDDTFCGKSSSNSCSNDGDEEPVIDDGENNVNL